MKKRIYLWETILDKLIEVGVKSHDVDIRHLIRWIKLYKDCFPSCVIKDNYTAVFNGELCRWEIWSGRHEINFNPQNYL